MLLLAYNMVADIILNIRDRSSKVLINYLRNYNIYSVHMKTNNTVVQVIF